MRHTIVIVILTGFFIGFECRGLNEEFTWTRINYLWPDASRESRSGYYNHKGDASSSPDAIVFPGDVDKTGSNSGPSSPPPNQNNFGGSYIYENNIPMGANRWKDKLFITVPRRRAGVPSTVNFVWTNSTQKHNLPLIPYPSWRMNQFEPSREDGNFVSVYRVAIDACDRMWMIDTGLIEIPGNNSRVKPEELIIMDLNTDKIIRRYTFKPSDVNPRTTLANLVLDLNPSACNKAYAYIPDLSGYGLVVYDFQENDSWRITHNYFYLEPNAGEFYIGGQHFQWNDGIFSAALSKVSPDGHRNLYFHSMAGTHLYSVSTKILRDKQLATRSYHGNDFKIVIDRGEGAQTSASALHQPSGVLFLALVNKNAVGCWNINKEPKRENFAVIHQHDKKLIYPSDIKVYEDEVIVLSNTMPVFLYSKLNYNEVNFRVWITKVSDAVKDTVCA